MSAHEKAPSVNDASAPDVEAVARAIYDQHWQEAPWETRVDVIRERYTMMAEAAIAALDEFRDRQ